MKDSTTTVRPTGLPADRREARHWIERQLRWERTLGALRDRRAPRRPAEQAA